MSILYCDCFSGISGDMFLGALLDAGLPVEYLEQQFRRLNLPEFRGVAKQAVQKGALAATLLDLDIQADEDHHNHHAHTEPENQSHDQIHHPPHGQRNLNDIRRLIEASQLSETVQQTSLAIFQKLAEAEAKVHGSPIEQVHFHEVGAVDSILDIVGAAVGLEYFNIQAVYSSSLPLGSGQVQTQHGILPLPAPATLELIRMAQAPVTPSPAKLELVTPTGAAILATLASFTQPEMRIFTVGIGAGRRNLDWPNILRVFIGESLGMSSTHLEIETNIDDMNPQVYGHVMARLFQYGALDVYFTPVFMKKNRPATRLSVIAHKEDEDKICELLLQETSTLGVRVKPVWRHEAQRAIRNVQTSYGSVPVKVKLSRGIVIQATPEYDACVEVAEKNNLPVLQVIKEVERAAWALFQDRNSAD